MFLPKIDSFAYHINVKFLDFTSSSNVYRLAPSHVLYHVAVCDKHKHRLSVIQ